MEKKCNTCGEVKPLSEFSTQKQCKDGHTSDCKDCRATRQQQIRRTSKVRAIEYKGGKCENCGGVFHYAAFDFHHVNPEEKEINPSAMRHWSWDRQKAELDKCVLLCANCHRIEHYGDND